MGDLTSLAVRASSFFSYFRARHAVAARDDVPLPDRLVILSASLDALAKHWSDTSPLTIKGSSPRHIERMRAFLILHGAHDSFERVSAPMLRAATKKEIGSFPFGGYRPNQMNRVRSWQDDPKLKDLEASHPKKELVRWSYPGILYADLRCAWVHEFLPINENLRVNEFDSFGRNEPYYRYMSNTGDFLLMLPVGFLLATLERTIQSFEHEAQSGGFLPFLER